MLNPRLVDIFRTVCETGSATSAANCLNTTQPNVTRAIGQLESYCQFRLFDRGRFGMRLTPEGVSLLESVQRSYRGLISVSRAISEIKGGAFGALTATALPILVDGWLCELAARFGAQNPTISIRVLANAPDKALHMLVSGHADFAMLIGLPPVTNELEVRRLGECEMVAVARRDSGLLERDEMTFSDLDGELLIQLSPPHHVRGMVETMIASFGIRPKGTHEVSTQRGVVAMVREMGGVGLIDSYAARGVADDVLTVRPVAPRVSWPINLIHRKGEHTPAFKSFLSWLDADLERRSHP
jgi:DNA-binding transcriptional LysR family regulator